MARQHSLEQWHRPGLERLRQQRMVGVIEQRRRDRPRNVPRNAVQVDQQPHEFGNGDGRMRVVELDRGMVGQQRQLTVQLLVPADEILQRRGCEEEFLTQPQDFAGRCFVAGIQDARNRLEPNAIGQRADVVAAIEVLERNRIGGARGPQPKRIHAPAAPTGDRRVECHGRHRFLRMPDMARRSVAVDKLLHGAAEVHAVDDVRPLELPRIAERQPVLRQFVLPAVLHDLPENAVVVPDAVAVGRDLQRRHAFHEARGKAAQTAVAQRRIGLELAQPVEIDAQEVERAAHCRREAQVRHRVGQQASDEEFEREVVNAFAPVAAIHVRRFEPAIDDAVAHRERRRHEPVVVERAAGILAHHVGELREDCVAHVLGSARHLRVSRRRGGCVVVVAVGTHADLVGQSRLSDGCLAR